MIQIYDLAHFVSVWITLHQFGSLWIQLAYFRSGWLTLDHVGWHWITLSYFWSWLYS